MARELTLEVRGQEDRTVAVGPMMLTPLIDEGYWKYRVMLSDTQAIVGFPKFFTVGIGFAVEEDWNTNLPHTCLDLAAVQADDALINQLAGRVVVTDSELARVLYAWRRDVESEPFPLSADVASRVVVESWSLRRRVVSWFRRLLRRGR